MSSTRTAKDDSVFHQSRYASSPEFERGLVANLVAKRAALLDSPADRELVWFIQYLSHQKGGLAFVVNDLAARYANRVQTAEMAEIGIKLGKILDANEVKKIRAPFLVNELDKEARKGLASQLLLNGEHVCSWTGEIKISEETDERPHKHPTSYPASLFIDLCHATATNKLENELREICLNPRYDFDSGPWYMPGLISTLREYQTQYISARGLGVVTTELGKKVCEVLDYTAYSRGLTFMEGDARMGKSFAARTWCEKHPGTARFVSVPDGNDDASFFRDIARGLGLGSFLNYKVVQIRERVESVLRSGDITLVLDEAQRLFPQTHFRAGYPKRVVWVMTMADAGIPICMIATPQFFSTLKVIEKNGWNSAQLIGRIGHIEMLPPKLSVADLISVARSVLPEASADVLDALATYAEASARYLAAIDTISKRARYIAKLDGRDLATAKDVRRAMNESVIPADTKLHVALQTGKTPSKKPVGRPPASRLQEQPEPLKAPDKIISAGRREVAPPVSGSRSRAENSAPLIEA